MACRDGALGQTADGGAANTSALGSVCQRRRGFQSVPPNFDASKKLAGRPSHSPSRAVLATCGATSNPFTEGVLSQLADIVRACEACGERDVWRNHAVRPEMIHLA